MRVILLHVASLGDDALAGEVRAAINVLRLPPGRDASPSRDT